MADEASRQSDLTKESVLRQAEMDQQDKDSKRQPNASPPINEPRDSKVASEEVQMTEKAKGDKVDGVAKAPPKEEERDSQQSPSARNESQHPGTASNWIKDILQEEGNPGDNLQSGKVARGSVDGTKQIQSGATERNRAAVSASADGNSKKATHKNKPEHRSRKSNKKESSRRSQQPSQEDFAEQLSLQLQELERTFKEARRQSYRHDGPQVVVEETKQSPEQVEFIPARDTRRSPTQIRDRNGYDGDEDDDSPEDTKKKKWNSGQHPEDPDNSKRPRSL